MAHSSIHINAGAVASVNVFVNSVATPDLIVCNVVESEQFYRADATLTADRSVWQQIADQLGALGICPQADGSQKESTVRLPEGHGKHRAVTA